jgi:hypothetical protein
VTRALPLENIKGEAGATSRGPIETQLTEQALKLIDHKRDLGPAPSFEGL